MTWILIVAGALLLVLLCTGALIFSYTCVRHKEPDYSDLAVLRASQFAKCEDYVTRGMAWLRQHETEPLQVVSYDGKLLSAQLLRREDARGTVLLFNGYRSSYVIDFSGALQFYYDLGYNLLICDQRSHGKSRGRCITFGVKERNDVVSWATYLAMLLGEEHPLYLCGLSMGATTVLMASELEFYGNVRGVVADCGFTSPKEIITHVARKKMHLPAAPLLPLLGLFTRVFAGFGLSEASTEQALARTKLPVLLIHGTDDHFVPCEMTRKNFAACASEKEMMLVEGANHGQSYVREQERYECTVAAFLEKHLEG